MKNTVERRLEEITPRTLVVGIDIAKTVHWARFTDYRGVEIGKPMSFTNDLQGFTSIVTRINELCKTVIIIPQYPFDNVIIGMEPTGQYWKILANYLEIKGYRVVGVNPSHTKKSKELDDNSQTKNDKKDAITIARLVKDGRYFELHLPQNIYGELRVLTNERTSSIRRQTAIKNIITAMLDEYFPEFKKVFKKIFKGKSSRQILL